MGGIVAAWAGSPLGIEPTSPDRLADSRRGGMTGATASVLPRIHTHP
jgi:hypothetical protein